jgi:hypothetical protein
VPDADGSRHCPTDGFDRDPAFGATLVLPSADELGTSVETWLYYDGPLLYTAHGAGREWLVLAVDQVDVKTPLSESWPHAHYVFVFLAAPLPSGVRSALAAGPLTAHGFWTDAAARGQVAILREGRECGLTRLAGPVPEEWLPAADVLLSEYMPECGADG